jgi:hypothetical protein
VPGEDQGGIRATCAQSGEPEEGFVFARSTIMLIWKAFRLEYIGGL